MSQLNLSLQPFFKFNCHAVEIIMIRFINSFLNFLGVNIEAFF